MVAKRDELEERLTAAQRALVAEHLRSNGAPDRSTLERVLTRLPRLPRAEVDAPTGNLHDEIAWVLRNGTRPRD
jgi:hypothetical protein